MYKQIEQRPGIGFQAFQRHIAACQLRLLGRAGGFQGGIQIIGVLLVPAAIAFQVQAHQQVVAIRSAAARQLAVHSIARSHGEQRRKSKVNSGNQRAPFPALVRKPQTQGNIVPGQGGKGLMPIQQTNHRRHQKNDGHGADKGTKGQGHRHSDQFPGAQPGVLFLCRGGF